MINGDIELETKHLGKAKIYLASYHCDPGYKLFGDNERRCSPDGIALFDVLPFKIATECNFD